MHIETNKSFKGATEMFRYMHCHTRMHTTTYMRIQEMIECIWWNIALCWYM